MRLLKLLPILFLFSCIDLIIQEEKYNSLYFTGGSWIEFAEIDSMKLESNDFTIQFWVSGGEVNTNEAPAMFSIIEKIAGASLVSTSPPETQNWRVKSLDSNFILSSFPNSIQLPPEKYKLLYISS